MIAHVLAEKDTLRCQLVELQEKVFSLQTKCSSTELHQSSEVNFLNTHVLKYAQHLEENAITD